MGSELCSASSSWNIILNVNNSFPENHKNEKNKGYSVESVLHKKSKYNIYTEESCFIILVIRHPSMLCLGHTPENVHMTGL